MQLRRAHRQSKRAALRRSLRAFGKQSVGLTCLQTAYRTVQEGERPQSNFEQALAAHQNQHSHSSIFETQDTGGGVFRLQWKEELGITDKSDTLDVTTPDIHQDETKNTNN